jgi:plastocyanin
VAAARTTSRRGMCLTGRRRLAVVKRTYLIFLLSMATIAAAALAAPNTVSISIKSQAFTPASVEAKVGDTIIWTNNDDRDHSVAASDGSFKSDNLRPGASFSFKPTKAGRISFSCSYHPREKGTINVSEK